MAQPEHHAHAAIRCFMQALSFDGDKKFMPIKIRQMAMLTCGAVLVDILPSYKITKLSEVQMKEKVKKDLKILRQYEQGITRVFTWLRPGATKWPFFFNRLKFFRIIGSVSKIFDEIGIFSETLSKSWPIKIYKENS